MKTTRKKHTAAFKAQVAIGLCRCKIPYRLQVQSLQQVALRIIIILSIDRAVPIAS